MSPNPAPASPRPTVVLVASLVTCLLATGTTCAGSGREAPSTPEPFELVLSIGGEAGHEDLWIRVINLVEESRCPKGVTCVWEGRVRITVEVSAEGVAPHEREMSSIRDEAQITVGGWTLRLEEVSPYPVNGQEIEAADYRFRFSVRRNA